MMKGLSLKIQYLYINNKSKDWDVAGQRVGSEAEN